MEGIHMVSNTTGRKNVIALRTMRAAFFRGIKQRDKFSSTILSKSLKVSNMLK